MNNSARPFVYGHVFESLTAGLYPNKQEILREYVQNGYDAIVAARSMEMNDANLIRIQVDGNNLFIHDEGIGMDSQGIEEYRYFGYSRKKMDENVGFRGIGKLAGLAVADTMVVVTKKKGEDFCYTYKCEAHKMLKAVRKAKKVGQNLPLEVLIQQYSTIDKKLEEREKHYTSVQLYGIKDDEGYLTNEGAIIRYLSLVAPVPFNPNQFKYTRKIEEKIRSYIPGYQPIHIQVNGKQVFKPYNDDLPLCDLQFTKVNGKNDIKAICWYLAHKQAKQISNEFPRGLSYRCKGFAVGDETLARTTIFTAGRSAIAYWFVGEIYILDQGIIPSSSRTDFEDTPQRKRFYELAREQIGRTLNNLATQRSSESSYKKEMVKLEKKYKEVEKKFRNQSVLKEMKNQIVTEIKETQENLLKKAAKTKNQELKRQANEKVQAVNNLVKAIKKGEGIKDIKEELNLSGDAQLVYNAIITEITKWFKKNAPEELELFIATIHRALERRN